MQEIHPQMVILCVFSMSVMQTAFRPHVLQYDSSYGSLCVTQKGPPHLWPSLTNYYITLSTHDRDNRTAVVMYFLDSGGGSYPEVVSHAQVEWLNSTAQGLNPNSDALEIVFHHIPNVLYNNTQQGIPGQGQGMEKLPRGCIGELSDDDSSIQATDFGLVEALYARPALLAMFAGHNHGNDWCCPRHGKWLCYGRRTGYGGYGRWKRGARVLQFSLEEGKVELATHVIYENRTWDDLLLRDDGILTN